MRHLATRARRLPIAATAIAIALGVAGCAAPPEIEPTTTGPMVTVETRGGECPAGACGGIVVVERDGSVHATEPRPAQLGRLSEPAWRALEQAVRLADFDRLRSRPFRGECPVNVDGQEFIYTFGTPAGSVRLASCEVEIDGEDPLFIAVDAALSEVGAP